MVSAPGVLYVVATPIGNLADMTDRARDVLRRVDLIACEDTRQTRRLLTHFGIRAVLRSYHDHNERDAAPELIAALMRGESVALVSNAGTPLISDPGYQLVNLAGASGVTVVPVPGASALVCALSASGLPSDRFLFLGFPPRNSSRCRGWLESQALEPGTLIFYESGKRVLRFLEDLSVVLGRDRKTVVARELTKLFETFLRGSVADLIATLAGDEEQRLGELVVLVEGKRYDDAETVRQEQRRVLAILLDELPLKQAAALAARLTGGKRNQLYRLGLEMSRREA